MKGIYNNMYADYRKKLPRLAVLIDPDKFNPGLIQLAASCHVSYFFVGGSRIEKGNFESTITFIKKKSAIPVVIFPGDESQISARADALLFLSLLSGRNPEYLIGKQVLAAPIIKKKKLACISTAYILIEGGRRSVTEKVSWTKPIRSYAIKEILHTALAAELLGFKAIYLEAGSGAQKAIPEKIIREVSKNTEVPLLVGGGIDSPAKAGNAIKAGADIIVIGNVLEKYPKRLKTISSLF